LRLNSYDASKRLKKENGSASPLRRNEHEVKRVKFSFWSHSCGSRKPLSCYFFDMRPPHPPLSPAGDRDGVRGNSMKCNNT